MELLVLLAVLGVFLILVVLPFSVLSLRGRVRQLEERLFLLERAKDHAREEPKAMESAKTAAAETKDRPAPEAIATPERRVTPEIQSPSANPPALPPSTPVREEEAPLAPMPVLSEESSPVAVWLEKMGLKPPHPDEEGANHMAWWSTRVGLAFGVIAAVFLGMYVNKNTVPWVRLLELVAVALVVFGGGCWFERKLQGFGRALSAGGLALLFVSAYAAYGLPAMKVIDSPLLGTLAQAVALFLTAGWALWKGREAIFGLALILGYVTCSFAASEGLDSVPLIALVVLALAGTALFAWRNWWSGLWGAVFGSGLGLAVLAILTWGGEKGPSQWVMQGTILGLTALPLIALSWQWLQGEKRAKAVVPVVTSVGLFSGAIATGIRGFDFELFYAGFAALFLLAGWWWRRDEGEGLWQTLWAKAMVLVALFLIARFEGPVRAFSLLGQAGGLLWLARTRSRVVFEVGAVLAALVGWALLWNDSLPLAGADWRGERGLLLLYLVVGQVLLVGYRMLLGENVVRRVAGVFGAVLVALEVIEVTYWHESQLWLIGVPFAFGGFALLQRWPLRLKDAEWTPFVILIGTLVVLYLRYFEGVALAPQAVVWLLLGWSFYGWLGRSAKPRHLAGSLAVLAGSLPLISFVAEEVVGGRWLPAVFVGVAVLWHVLGSLFHYPTLRGSALLAGAAAIGFLTQNGWDRGFDAMVLATLLLAVAWWGWGWRNREEEATLENVADGFRTATLAFALWAFLSGVFTGLVLPLVTILLSSLILVAWRSLRAESLSWLGLVAAVMSVVRLSEQWAHSSYPWAVALTCILLAANGIWLARGGGTSVLALPKVASVIWGGSAILVVIVGLGMRPAVANWTTASWAIAAVALLVAGFWCGLRGYRIIALGGLAVTIVRLFKVDIQDSFWRIVAFGITGALLVGIGYLYNRFHKRLAEGDLDWGSPTESEEEKEDAIETEI